MKRIFSVWLVVCAISSVAAPAIAEKIRIGLTNPNMSFLPAQVAVKKGYFKDEGLEGEVIRMRVPVMITALTSGDLDYTMLFGSVVRAAVRGLPVRVVASLLNGSTHALVSRPEFKSVKDLRGRALGVESYGATSEVAARMMIKHFGVDPDKDIKILALGPDRARLAALKEKLVEVIVVAPPADEEARKMGFHVLARAYELFAFPFVGVGASVTKIKESANEVKRVIKALVKANRFIRENRDGAIQILAEWGKVDSAAAASAYDSTIKVFSRDGSIPGDGLRLVIDQAKKESNMTRDVPLSEVADFAFVREAQRELGLKTR